ncbi:hypothetical protein EPUL_003520 [Erysiphe pulchra]|uniref:NAD(P)-binding protein n=1 Tax=Erysiphe pulchra TaxID=225359 RepID=A0A2S4PYP2_9PEZI|nr:hypothetical protein EPUL_003520 [Erysiphe pulchra]
MPQIWVVVGASRDIGLELVTQLLARGDQVIATARSPSANPSPLGLETASKLWSLTGGSNGSNLTILECCIDDEDSIYGFKEQLQRLGRTGRILEKGVIDFVVLNTSTLAFPKRISEITFSVFTHFLNFLAVGPLITAQQLLSLSSPPIYSIATSSVTSKYASIKVRTLVFISSGSTSAENFKALDGFGVYSASIAALNQGIRHIAAELQRETPAEGTRSPVILATHPGDIRIETAYNPYLQWKERSAITTPEITKSILKIIKEKGYGGMDEGGWMTAEKEGGRFENGEASFWTWEGKRYLW